MYFGKNLGVFKRNVWTSEPTCRKFLLGSQEILTFNFCCQEVKPFFYISSDRGIDVIIALEDFCRLTIGNMKWGMAGEPVAEERTLGWILMGPRNASQG